MLKILFHRDSRVVRLLELVGVIQSIWFLKKHLPKGEAVTLLFLFLFVSYLLVRLCDAINWYPKKNQRYHGSDGGHRGRAGSPPIQARIWLCQSERIDLKRLGIRVQFRKAIVPSAYILAITAAIALLDIPYLSTGVVAFAVLLMLIIVPVNGILISFHLRDNDPMPINSLSLAPRGPQAPPAGPRPVGQTPAPLAPG